MCAFTRSSMCMNVLILTCCSCLLLSFCATLTLALLLVSALQSYSQWDSTDLPLCEAYRQRDSWASPGSSCSSTQGDREDVDGPPSQETNPQHHLNGHGTASIEKPWGGNFYADWSTHLHSVCTTAVWLTFLYTLWSSVWLGLPLLFVMGLKTGLKLWHLGCFLLH